VKRDPQGGAKRVKQENLLHNISQYQLQLTTQVGGNQTKNNNIINNNNNNKQTNKQTKKGWKREILTPCLPPPLFTLSILFVASRYCLNKTLKAAEDV